MNIVVVSDHAGFTLKEDVKTFLESEGHSVIDCGTYSKESCDYPVIAKAVAKAVVSGEYERGILICGTGIGMSIAANKVRGIRAALCSDTFSAHATREHNNSNILCLGQRAIGDKLALDIVDVWLKTEFSGDSRHQRRIDMIEE